jgi:ssDNA-binding Zn-finger/Zn-ribbon topoisomerase 1
MIDEVKIAKQLLLKGSLLNFVSLEIGTDNIEMKHPCPVCNEIHDMVLYSKKDKRTYYECNNIPVDVYFISK